MLCYTASAESRETMHSGWMTVLVISTNVSPSYSFDRDKVLTRPRKNREKEEAREKEGKIKEKIPLIG